MALQGGAELRQLGAVQLVINLVAVSMTRELGPLITAIVVVGRSGSAFSAEIGTMVVTEEVDALRSMALDPIEFLLVPKYIAMLLMLPCLTIAANTAGILAGGIYIYFTLDMGFALYIRAMLEALLLRDIVSDSSRALLSERSSYMSVATKAFTSRDGPRRRRPFDHSGRCEVDLLIILADLLFTAFFYFFWQ